MAIISPAIALFLFQAICGLAHPLAHGHSKFISPLSRRSVDLDRFRLKSHAVYVKADTVEEQNFNQVSTLNGANYVETATNLIKSVLPEAAYRLVGDHYLDTNGVGHVRFKQTVHDIDIDNADFNVNIAKDGSVLSYGHSFFNGEIPPTSPLTRRQDISDPVEALRGATDILELSIDTNGASAEQQDGENFIITGTSGAAQDPKVQLMYLRSDNDLKLTWRVETNVVEHWLLTYVDAQQTNQAHGVVDWVVAATYNAYPWGTKDPSEGSRTNIVDPFDTTTSEFGWHSSGTTSFTTTQGNNGISHTNYRGALLGFPPEPPIEGAPGLVFDFPYDPSSSDTRGYSNASVTQLFYTANKFHDIIYKLGFTEAAGNFESNNNGQGGVGNDAVILYSQDGSHRNNAFFGTPPDGQSGVMYMLLFDYDPAAPIRDSSFSQDIVVHEYTHGLSNRLTGGPANSNCLTAFESGGMGEGWSDFYALANILVKNTDTRASDKTIGDWATGLQGGIREFPYSTNAQTNPLRYSTINSYPSMAAHAIGTVWATMLYELLWNLIEKHGNTAATSPTLNNGIPIDGRFLVQKLVLDGMALQPCNPTFLQARDAIIDADNSLTGGDNVCEIWTAFAKRGLGQNAAGNLGAATDDFTVPAGVC